MLNVFYMIEGLLPKNPPKLSVWDLKVIGCKKYWEVLFGKSDAYKSKYTLKPLLNQNMVNLI